MGFNPIRIVYPKRVDYLAFSYAYSYKGREAIDDG